MAAKGQKPLKLQQDEDVVPAEKIPSDDTMDLTPETKAPESSAPSLAPADTSKETDQLAEEVADAGRRADADILFRRAGALASLGRQNPDQILTSDIEARRNAPLTMFKARQEARKAAAEQALQAAHGRYFQAETEQLPLRTAETARHNKAEEEGKTQEYELRGREFDQRQQQHQDDMDQRWADMRQRHLEKLEEIKARYADARTDKDKALVERELGQWKDQGKAIQQLADIDEYASGRKKIPEWDPLMRAREDQALEQHPGLLGRAGKAVFPVEQARSDEQNDYMAKTSGPINELLHQAYGSRLTPAEIARKAQEYHTGYQYSPQERQKALQKLSSDIKEQLSSQTAKLSPLARETAKERGANIYEGGSPNRAPSAAAPAVPDMTDPKTGQRMTWNGTKWVPAGG